MKNAIKIQLGQKIRALRKERDLTQEKLAELTGLDYKYIQRIEGKTPPSVKIETLEKIAKAFKVSCSKLLDF